MKLFRFLRIILKGKLRLLESIYHKIWVRDYCLTIEEIIKDQDIGMYKLEKTLIDKHLKEVSLNLSKNL